MKELFHVIDDFVVVIGEISPPLFVGLIILMIVGNFLDLKKSSFWRKLMTYLGNVDIESDQPPSSEFQ